MKCLEFNVEDFEIVGIQPYYRIQLRKTKDLFVTLLTVRDYDIALVWFSSLVDLLKKLESIELSGW
jgi:hypothetical protein